MWDSPIKQIADELNIVMECEIMTAVQRFGIDVDKEELIKALDYDRNQYEKGYSDGYSEAITEFAEKLKEILYERTESFRDIRFLTVEAIDILIFEISEKLKVGGKDD